MTRSAKVSQPTLFQWANDQYVRDHERPTRALHIHTLEAHDATADEMRGRKRRILNWLRLYGPATDRQVRNALFGDLADMNAVRPRITELITSGDCHEVGTEIDATTGLHVRLVRAKNEGEV